ncbi:MAG TPA: GH3 auxin-responsive promoter family protein [Tepidisphaeraceae bacterium]|nr:GH3 auxin-responsive promoter family protein [Tepidisphaeraceae bacterium]
MSAQATIANGAWWLSCLPAWWSFRRALAQPHLAQRSILHRLIRRSAETQFGRHHAFAGICDYRDFASRVPIRDYAELEPWIDRIRRGENKVLAPDRVIRLATTSGTTNAQKLIPYTTGLQAEFNRAIGPWMVDLFNSDPRLITGSAYWSISPVMKSDTSEESAVPIGFEQDSEYLGGIRRRLVDWVMAVPPGVRHATDIEEFRRSTLAHLQRHRDLRLISIWHPSFLTLLLAGQSHAPRDLWPRLRLISCWADGQAALAARELSQRFTGVRIQPKGLIATEAIISIPFRRKHPLAITSHFLEFVDESGKVYLAHELVEGREYELVVTTGGGLWRYKLNDVIQVNGAIDKTPSIRFVGKAGNISDLFGEKLSDAFVARVIERLRIEQHLSGAFAMLAPEQNAYILYVQGNAGQSIGHHLDQMLRENLNYAYCRDLGQLAAPRLFKINKDPNAAIMKRLTAQGHRLGDIKPVALSRLDCWHEYFEGTFLT